MTTEAGAGTGTDAFASVPATRREGRIGGRRTTWWEAGPDSGPPLVLLHGAGLDEARLSWGSLIGPLGRAGHRVIAPDLPGYGGSDGFGRPYAVADLAGFTATFCDTLALARPALCGISMGGGTVLSAAIARRGLARAVVAVAPYGLIERADRPRLYWLAARLPLAAPAFALVARSDRAARRSTARLFGDPTRLDDALVAQVRTVARRPGAARSFKNFAKGEMQPAGFATYLTPDLALIDCPVTLIHGREDPLIPHAASERAAALAGLPLRSVPGGHLLPRERPDETLAAILDAIA